MSARRLVVLSRPDCELCSELIELLEPYVATGVVTLLVADLAEQPLPVRKRQQWRIPVVLDGDTELMWGRIEREEVARVLGPVPTR